MSNENYLLISWLVYSTSDHVDSDSEVNTGRFRFEIFCKTERLRTICLLYGFLLCLCRPPIGPWSLWENNALELANQSMCYTHYKHEPHLNTSCYKKVFQTSCQSLVISAQKWLNWNFKTGTIFLCCNSLILQFSVVMLEMTGLRCS